MLVEPTVGSTWNSLHGDICRDKGGKDSRITGVERWGVGGGGVKEWRDAEKQFEGGLK